MNHLAYTTSGEGGCHGTPRKGCGPNGGRITVGWSIEQLLAEVEPRNTSVIRSRYLPGLSGLLAVGVFPERTP